MLPLTFAFRFVRLTFCAHMKKTRSRSEGQFEHEHDLRVGIRRASMVFA